MATKCPRCGRENAETARYCGGCGLPLQPARQCSRCGHRSPTGDAYCGECGQDLRGPDSGGGRPPPPLPPQTPSLAQPTAFANGRYVVRKFLGEGGKKKVYLAQDTLLDREIAFALIKAEGLDEASRARITREAQAMGKLGSHPHIVTVYDLGEHEGQPYMVIELMRGGDLEGLLKKAPEHKLTLEKALDLSAAICRGLEYAHTRGIIHRDIKPGNIWLTEAGLAKVGDFGLALASERARLTAEGMMVGTVLYMPPEQAMGGEAGPAADLYSLGATLYEMVAGRPPFLGQDAVGIIGQHLNTPPVSPGRYRADLPAALEALIMQLLEKDPAKRPASATEVLTRLGAIASGATAESDITTGAPLGPSPIYRRVFVGREAELRRLQSAFDAAVAGQGGLVMVVGEPGIGKTALCEQLATYAGLRGGRTLVGHCYEKGSLSLPYLAFVEAMRSYVLDSSASELHRLLGSGAPYLSRIVSEVRERLQVAPPPAAGGEEDHYRLLQSVSDFLGSAAVERPLLMVLEDLHDADQGTLDMLSHVAHSLAGRRLLVVGTYRDVAVDRGHPLSAALAELQRLASFERVALRGLTADEVQRMLSAIAGSRIDWGLSEAVYRQTEGNPLFVQEVLRHLVEEGILREERGTWKALAETPAVMRIPEGLRDVIGKRLTRLSPECNRLLQTAAVIGREFPLKVLQKVAAASEEALYDACQEATAAAVVEERAQVGGNVTYRFAHAFFRQILYEEVIAPRRIRLHQQVARVLEEGYGARKREHAAELAEHYSHSSDPADLTKAVHYGEMAAERASAVFADAEAARLLQQALQVQEVLDPEDKAKITDLHLLLGYVLAQSGESRHAFQVEAPTALALAQAIGDQERAGSACLLALHAFAWSKSLYAFSSPEFRQWMERVRLYVAPDNPHRVLFEGIAEGSRLSVRKLSERRDLISRALEAATSLGDARSWCLVAMCWVWLHPPQYAATSLQAAEELAMVVRGQGPPRLNSLLLRGYYTVVAVYVAGVFLMHGLREQAEEMSGAAKEMAERIGRSNVSRRNDRVITMWWDCVWAVVDGRLEEALQTSQRLKALGDEAGISDIARVFALPGHRARLLLGGAEEALAQVLPDEPRPQLRTVILAHLGQRAQVGELLERLVVERPDFGTPEDSMAEEADVSLLEAAVLVEHHQAAHMLLTRLAECGGRTTGDWLPTCTGRHLGAAAQMLGKPEEALGYYEQALDIATRVCFRPEVALIRLQLAELFLEHYPGRRSEAMAHLSFAVGEFREMKMGPALERALGHRGLLKA